ncbi:MAG: Gfo/Idh/MocA family oxidoreductase [Pyrinomonadaceae bacterium]
MAIRMIVAGMGQRGRDWAREVRADARFELAACVDVNADALREAANGLAVAPERCFTQVESALDQTACEALIVATDADHHTNACHAALARGLGVLVEKPFTLRLSEAVELVELAEQKGVPLVVAQNYRYMRAHRAARRLIREGALGRIATVVSQYYRVPHMMAASLARLPHSVMWGMGVHHIDALRYVLGAEITSVAAQSFTPPWSELPEGSSLQVMLAFDSGARGLYSATYESSGHEFFERGQEFYQRFVGERATLHVFHRWLVLCERGRLPRLVRRGPRAVTEENILLEQMRRALLDGETPESSGRDNLRTVAVMEACVRSSTERRWINPQELLEHGIN